MKSALILFTIFVSAASYAGNTMPSTFTYQGRVMNAAGTAPLTGNLTFYFEIYNPAKSCMIFSESQTVNTADGIFSVQVGAGTRIAGVAGYANDPGYTMTQAFHNTIPFAAVPGSCVAGWTPGLTDSRKLVLHVYDGTTTTTLADQTLTPVPQALVADSLDGVGINGFVQSWTTVTRPSNPVANTTVGWNITLQKLEMWTGAAWSPKIPKFAVTTADDTAGDKSVMKWNAAQKYWEPADVNTLIALTGDVTGTAAATVVSALQGYTVDLSTAPNSGQFLKWNGTKWIASDAAVSIAAGSGTNNVLSKFSAGGVLKDSDITDDGTTVTVAVPMSMNSKNISNLLDPVAAQDAATRNYVDTKIGNNIPTGTATGQLMVWNNIGAVWGITDATGIANNKYLKWNGTTWIPSTLSNTDIGGPYVKTDGSTPMTGDWAFGNFKMTGASSISAGSMNANDYYFTEQAASPAVAAGMGQVYAKADHNLYYKDGNLGTEQQFVFGTGAGEVNVGANIGTGAIIYKDKTGVTLEFKTLQSPNATIALAADAGGNMVNVDIAQDSAANGQVLKWNGTKWTPVYNSSLDSADGSVMNALTTANNGTLTATVVQDTITGAHDLADKTYVDAKVNTVPDIDAATTNGQVLVSNGTKWAATTLTSGKIIVGNGAIPSAATPVAVSGDATLSNAGAVTVVGIQGKVVDATAPSVKGQVYFWDNANTKWKVSSTTVPTDGQVMTWDDTALTWKYTTPAAGISIAGTPTYIPVFNGAGTNISNSTMTDDATKVSFTTYPDIATSKIYFNGSQFAHDNAVVTDTFVGINTAPSATGGNNTGVGNNALNAVVAGTNDTAVGSQALKLATGGSNTAVGYTAGQTVTTGTNNTFIGAGAASANVAAASASSVVIGYNAGPATAATDISNKLYIANSTTDTPLMLGNFSTPALTVNGTLNVAAGYGFGLPQIASGAAETTLITGWGATQKGFSWFRTDTGSVSYWNGTAVKTLGVAGSGLASINTDTTNAQTITVGTTGTAPAIVDNGTGDHKLNIPMADAGAGVTAGLVSNAEVSRIPTAGTVNGQIWEWDSGSSTWKVSTATAQATDGNFLRWNNTSKLYEPTSNIAIGSANGIVTLSGVNAMVTGLSAPVAASDAANKNYVDTAVSALPTIDPATTNGQLLRSNGTKWTATTLTSGQILVGNGAAPSVATAVSVSGDATMSNAGAVSVVKIQGNTVDATAPTIKGQVYFWDAANSKWKVSSTTAPTDGQVMTWDDTAKTWKYTTPAAGTAISGGTSTVLSMFNPAGTNVINSSVTDNGASGVDFGNSLIEFGGHRFISGTGANVGIGIESGATYPMKAISTGYNNIGIGNNSTAIAVSSGTDNIAIGMGALQKENTGENNIAIGTNALQNATGGTDSSVAVGYQALRTGANFTTAIGAQAFGSATGGHGVAVGYFAGNATTTGTSNVALGYYAMPVDTTGSNNISMGDSALFLAATGSNNVAIGSGAGYNANAASAGNVFLGNQAGPTAAGAISNKLYIANSQSNSPLIGGDFSTPAVTVNGTLNVASGYGFGLPQIASGAAETTLITGWGATQKGFSWFRTDTGSVSYWNGTAVKTLGVAGSGLASINTDTTNAQTLSVGTSGNAPAWVDNGTGDHKINIPMADAAGTVTAGLISNAEYARIPTAGTVNGQIWEWDSGSSTWKVSTATAQATDGNFLRWNNTSKLYEPTSNIAIGSANGIVTLSGVNAIVTGLSAPVAASDAANKAYVDGAVGTVPTIDAATTNGQLLRSNGTKWAATTLTSGQMLVGNGASPSVATAVTMSSDATMTGTGAVTVVKIQGNTVDATAPTIKGQVYFWDAVNSKWKVSSTTAPTDGQVMTWDDTAKTWKYVTPSSGGTTISGGTSTVLSMFNPAGTNVINSSVTDNGAAGVNFGNSIIQFGGSTFIHTAGNTDLFMGANAGGTPAAAGAAGHSVGIGANALRYISTGTNNIAIGEGALATDVGSNNTAVGFNAAINATAGSASNVFIGKAAGPTVAGAISNKLYIANSQTDTPLIGGDFSSKYIQVNGYEQVAEQAAAPSTPGAGYGSMYVKTDHTLHFLNSAGTDLTLGAGSVSGTGTLNQMTKWSNTTGGLVDSTVADDGTKVTFSTYPNISTSKIYFGGAQFEHQTGATTNTFVGLTTAPSATGGNNSAYGNNALNAVVAGTNSTAIGSGALKLATGGSNTALGYSAGQTVTTGTNNTFLGTSAAGANAAAASTGSVVIGYNAGPATAATDITNKLYINNSQSDTPLIAGDFSAKYVQLNGYEQVAEQASAPSTPGAGYGSMYVKTDHTLHFLNSAGTDVTLGNSATGTGTANKMTKWNNTTGALVDSTVTDNATKVTFSTYPDVTTAKIYFNNVPFITQTGSASNTFVGQTIAPSATGANNTAMGQFAMGAMVGGAGNTAVGSSALYANISNVNNTAIGYNAANALKGDNNVAVGYTAMNQSTTGQLNVAVGNQAMRYSSTAAYTTAIGEEAMANIDTGAGNTALGYAAGIKANGASANNVFLGNSAGPTVAGAISNKLYIANTQTDTPLIGGDFSSGYVTINGYEQMKEQTLPTTPSAGYGAMWMKTDHSLHFLNSAGTDLNLSTLPTGSGTTGVIPKFSNTTGGTTNSSVTDNGATGVDFSNYILTFNSAGTDHSRFISKGSNVGLGEDDGYGASDYPLHSITTGYFNYSIGSESMANVTTGIRNSVMGAVALKGLTDGAQNVAIGTNAIGAGDPTLATAVGDSAAAKGMGGGYGVAIGGYALQNSTAAHNVGVGYNVGNTLTSGQYNVLVGDDAADKMTTGGSNVAIGSSAMHENLTGTDNTAVGTSSLYNATTTGNTAVGSSAGSALTTGYDLTAIGYYAATHSTTGTDNTAVGYNSLNATTTNKQNTAVGASALYATKYTIAANSGDDNVAVGFNAGNTITTGKYNVFVGSQAGSAMITSSYANVIIGYQAATQVTTATSGAVIIGANAGPATVGAATNKLFINNAQSDTPLIAGDFSAGSVTINGAGGVTATQYLYSSDRRLKTNIETLQSPLDKISQLRGVSFNWIKNGNPEIGLIAQEVEQVYPELVSTNENGMKAVKYGNLVAPLIEATKAINVKCDMSQTQIASVDSRVAVVERKIASLEQQNKDLKQQVDALQKAVQAIQEKMK